MKSKDKLFKVVVTDRHNKVVETVHFYAPTKEDAEADVLYWMLEHNYINIDVEEED